MRWPVVVGDGAVELARLKEETSAARRGSTGRSGWRLSAMSKSASARIACPIPGISEQHGGRELLLALDRARAPDRNLGSRAHSRAFRCGRGRACRTRWRVSAGGESRVQNRELHDRVRRPLVGFAATGIPCGKSGIDGDRAIIVGDRLVIVAAQHVDIGALIERLDVPWIDRDRARVILDRAIEITLRLIERAAIGKSARTLRDRLSRAASKSPSGAILLAEREIGPAAIDEGARCAPRSRLLGLDDRRAPGDGERRDRCRCSGESSHSLGLERRRYRGRRNRHLTRAAGSEPGQMHNCQDRAGHCQQSATLGVA